MIQIWQVPSECGPSNLVVLALNKNFKEVYTVPKNFQGVYKVPKNFQGPT